MLSAPNTILDGAKDLTVGFWLYASRGGCMISGASSTDFNQFLICPRHY